MGLFNRTRKPKVKGTVFEDRPTKKQKLKKFLGTSRRKTAKFITTTGVAAKKTYSGLKKAEVTTRNPRRKASRVVKRFSNNLASYGSTTRPKTMKKGKKKKKVIVYYE